MKSLILYCGAFFIIFFFPTSFAYTQLPEGKATIDSLQKNLLLLRDDTSKIKTLYNLALSVAPNDSAAALTYSSECFNLSKKIKWQKGIALSHLAYAKIFYEVSEYAMSLKHCDTAYSIFKKLNDIGEAGNALRATANAYDRIGDITKSLEYNYAALHAFEAANDKSGIGRSYNGLGTEYYRLLDYAKAIDNYKKALVIFKELNDKYFIASAIDNMASVFLDEGKYDSANVYNLQAIKVFEDINHLPAIARIYGNRGNLLTKMHDAKSAYDYYMRATNIDEKLGIKRELGGNYGSLGEFCLNIAKDSVHKYILPDEFKTSKENLLKKSKYYLAKALPIIKSANDIDWMMYYTKVASETEERLGNYKTALALHKDYSLYRDSIFNDENKKKIAALETERLTQVKNKEIQLLNQQRAFDASEVKRQTLIRNIIIASVIILALLSFIFIRAYNRRKKIAFNQQVSEVEMKALRAQMNPHFIFNSLHSINKYVAENDKENASVYLSKFASLMRLILENSREQEVPLEKDLHALELYMQLEALRFKNKFTYSIETDPAINKENTLIPPMLLQPFVENAIVHGFNQTGNGIIKIVVHKENDMMKCVIEDNGSGRQNIAIDVDENRKRKSLGMKIITERLNIINQLKKVKAAINIFDLKDTENKPRGLRIELLLPLESAF
jgi:tetratricopeptide (TPR) repeat protein